MSRNRASFAEQGLTALQVNWDVVAALLLFFASFALYARTAAPGVLDGDFGEFQTNIYLLGVSHTGYPLYFLLAKLWTLLMPVGNIAYRANVFSGFFGALTLVLIYFTLRTLNLSLLVSLFSSVLFGVSRVYWSQSVIPDVYTLNSFFIVLVLWLAILWRMGRVPLWWVALAFGFSLTHHRTMIWLAPALGIFVLWGLALNPLKGGGRKIFQPRELWKTIAALFLPLLLYLYIPLRGASDVGVEYHASSFTEMILASNVSVWLRFGPPGFIWERITQVYLTLLVEQFTPIGFAFGLLGIAALASKRVPRNFPESIPPRQFLLLIGLAHLVETAFAIVFWVVDSEIFFIPSYLTFLFFVAIGIALAWDWLASRLTHDVLRPALRALVIIGFLALCGYVLWQNFPRNDQSWNDAVQARWQEILAQPLEENATIMGPWEDLTPLEYFQYVENVRRDLKRKKVIIYQDQLALAPQPNLEREVASELKQDNVFYLTRHPADTETLRIFKQFHETLFESLWRLDLRTAARGEYGAIDNGDADALTEFRLGPKSLHAGDFVKIDLNWNENLDTLPFELIWRVTDTQGHRWVDRSTQTYGGRPIERSPKGLFAMDRQGFFLPPDMPPGFYALELYVRKQGSDFVFTFLKRFDHLAVQLEVAAAETAQSNRFTVPRHLNAARDDKNFRGYDVSNTEPRGGDILEFSSWWQNISRADDAFEIKLRDANDIETILYQGALFPNARGIFNPAQIVRARNDIAIPPQAAAGYARILLSLNGQALPPLRVALQESHRKFRVPIIQRPQLTLVGDALQLLGYKLDRTQYRAGETIPLVLYWSANQTPSASFKVFVHFIDANGILRAQQDAIPQRGALPINRWFAGEYITDEYALQLPNDLAAGEYRIVVGMYDETSGVRVPLTDANGARIANDAVTLGDVIQIR